MDDWEIRLPLAIRPNVGDIMKKKELCGVPWFLNLLKRKPSLIFIKKYAKDIKKNPQTWGHFEDFVFVGQEFKRN